jgi:hypothetical protein
MTALTLTPTLARRLFITKQRLAGPRAAADARGLFQVVRSLGCLQLDPISVVARSHQLVLFSRVGAYDRTHLDQLLWQERALFEYWAHCASIVLTEDYPIHHARMRAYRAPAPPRQTPWGGSRMRQWVKDNDKLKRFILRELKRRGPLLSRDLEEEGAELRTWVSTGWTSGRNISQMLDYLWMSGQIMVTARQGGQKVWDLAERVLPEWTPREKLSEYETTCRAIRHSIRALGLGTEKHIRYHFVRGRYPHFKEALADLLQGGQVQRVAIKGWPGDWFMLAEDEPLLAGLSSAEVAVGEPARATLLSPFDNLIADRARTFQMFNFDFRIEIYTPVAKRKYGYYVLPILHGDRLIGRVDPVMERTTGQLRLNAVYAEPGAPRQAGAAIAAAITELATFLGAREIRYNPQRVPSIWKRALKP